MIQSQKIKIKKCKLHKHVCSREFSRKRTILKPLSQILKANLSWSPTWAKFCQLITSLSVVLPQLNQTKFKLIDRVPEVRLLVQKRKI